MIKKAEKLKPRGVRFADSEWAQVEQVAREETKISGDNINASDVIRTSWEEFNERREKKKRKQHD